MEWRQLLKKGAQAFRQRTRSPVCANPSPHHYLTVVHIYEGVISDYCCICRKKDFSEHKLRADKPGPITGLHLHLSGDGNAPNQDPKRDELMSFCGAAFVSAGRLHRAGTCPEPTQSSGPALSRPRKDCTCISSVWRLQELSGRKLK